MTKQYMKFDEFKTILFEAMEDDSAAWMGGIFWKVLDGSKNSLLLYYAVLKNEEKSIVDSTIGLLEKECRTICEKARVSGSIRFEEVSEDYKYKKEYKLFKNSITLESEVSDVEDLRKIISRTLSAFLMDQKIFVGFEMTVKNTGLSTEIKTEADGVKGAIASVKKMAENSDSFGGWSKVKSNLKKMADMPAKDFFIEYGDNFLGALAFKAVAGIVKGISKMKKKDTSAGSSSETKTPKWNNNLKSSYEFDHETIGGDKPVNLSVCIDNNANGVKAKIENPPTDNFARIYGNELIIDASKAHSETQIKLQLFGPDGSKTDEKEISITVESKHV